MKKKCGRRERRLAEKSSSQSPVEEGSCWVCKAVERMESQRAAYDDDDTHAMLNPVPSGVLRAYRDDVDVS